MAVYFIFRSEIFEHIRDGEGRVLEPFKRLVAARWLIGYKYESFRQAMDIPQRSPRVGGDGGTERNDVAT